jgi:CheY-like chemotaxis protein
LARKILLADDSVTAQNMGRKILADAGYEVIAVNNGSAALKKIAELKPDLVILDVYMPGYSGLEVCQRLKESQETSRIPVLLSVGKLEPFKPEEAQRVRADGYIVKPFEASELLSALSKLEDKVVPRSEPSKPGRFARAIAAAEESGRGKSNGDTNGWKSRISFPQEKKASTETADESPIYNPMNRDLRTVVETPGEKAAEMAVSAPAPQVEAAAEASVDVAALSPAALPRDVTPEEIAAIAAAAAQIKMADEALADAAVKYERRPSQVSAAEPEIVSAPGQTSQYRSEDRSEDRSAEETVDTPSAHKVYATGRPGEPDQGQHSEASPQEPSDLPVTMAATAESVAASSGASRWTAVSVALEGEDASVSLDQEMQKAHAAHGSGESEPDAPAREPERVSAETPMASAGSEPVAYPESVTAPEPGGSFPVPALAEPAFGEPVAAAVEAVAEIPASRSIAEPVPDPAQVAEFMSPVSEAEVAGLAGIVGLGAEIQQPPSQPEPSMATAEPVAVSETVKDTAAAWASWREVRDNGKAGEPVPTLPPVLEEPEPVPAESARAVAAGAEQILQEASVAPSNSPSDVASIVDSVLADLRPKLMAEISRKMAEKK